MINQSRINKLTSLKTTKKTHTEKKRISIDITLNLEHQHGVFIASLNIN